jgi:RHS repeat-associated protein
MAMAAELIENTHQGFEGIKAGLCLASMEAKSNIASGMPVCLWQNGKRSRSSGKERDQETGLDYFLARYYSGAQGRFTSPDPIIVSKRRMVNPQIWNAYSYVGNNPLNFVDPNGEELISLGATEKEIEKNIAIIDKAIATNKNLVTADIDRLNKEKDALIRKLQATKVINAFLHELDRVLDKKVDKPKLSDYTVSTNGEEDFAFIKNINPRDYELALSADFWYKKEYGDTIYVRADLEKGLYRMSQEKLNPYKPNNYSDYQMVGAAGAYHDWFHKQGKGELDALKAQLEVFE